jgi:hypothetical protein
MTMSPRQEIERVLAELTELVVTDPTEARFELDRLYAERTAAGTSPDDDVGTDVLAVLRMLASYLARQRWI